MTRLIDMIGVFFDKLNLYLNLLIVYVNDIVMC